MRPDFLYIGPDKSGSTWLYEVLRRHPEVFVPSVKDLYFFDPDNGMEVASVPFGRKDSSKYLYWQELQGIHEKGASILIYQHFPREKRDAFIARMVAEFQKRTAFEEIISFRTPHVVFFLLALVRYLGVFTSATQHLVNQWGISVSRW